MSMVPFEFITLVLVISLINRFMSSRFSYKLKILIIALTPLLVLSYKAVDQLLNPPPVPKLETTFWGPKELENKDDRQIYPFQIKISKEHIEQFKFRLNNTRLVTPSFENAAQNYGFNSRLLEEIIEFWKTQYDWKKTEDKLNKYPQYITNIQGLKVHFIHIKPSNTQNKKVIPLMLLNGWPSSFTEFIGIIPYLTTPRDNSSFVFEIVIPSLPGFGFSEAPVRPGLGAAQMGLIFKNLMERLGHKKFYLQGGDLGGLIIQHMGVLFPDNVLGMHLNMCVLITPLSLVKLWVASLAPKLFIQNPDHIDIVFPLEKFIGKLYRELGYLHIQSTKPDSIGVSLSESPAGLAAYILEKVVVATNEDYLQKEKGGLLEKYTYHDLLDNIMIYWWTNTIQTTFRFYAEIFNKAHMGLQVWRHQIKAPSACARFRHDFYTLNEALKEVYVNLLHTPDFDGGHFPALEMPQVLANDVYVAVRKFEQFHNSSR